MHRLLVILFIFFSNQTFAQHADFIMLKKHNKTIKRYYAGTEIEFTTTTGAYINAQIEGIKNDTLFLKQYVVKTFPTQLGVYVLDTVTTYYYKYHYNQIQSIGKSHSGFNLSASAASLMGGGVLLTLASGIVYLADREKFSPGLLIASASLATVGYIMAKTGGKGMVIGKKYQLVYLGVSDNEKSK
ncbi:hypothetical protein BH11BAC3_BH11BAC3_04080 [soil metagenome]